jgi:adenylylsulfate kinase|tara:strand:+ start:1199 stop:1798 length:600 start_codon:yes stop_codon:yes gene_type:complete
MDNLFSTNHELITKSEKEKLLKQKGICLWLTGLSGSGKTSIAKALAKKLHSKGFITKVLDGDNIRLGINKNLTFSELDRMENVRRTAEISKLFVDCGIVTICCLVSPKKNMRNLAKKIIGKENFNEIFIDTSLEECEIRDTKGLYKRARNGELLNFTGISSTYEKPVNTSLNIPTNKKNIEESSEILYNFVLPLISELR